MRTLTDVRPTPEQLAIVSRNKPGIEVIRGAAGSGKTTTALLRLRSLIGMFVSRRNRMQDEKPVRILVLTYNRTLRGYIEELAKKQVKITPQISLEIMTFASWARKYIGPMKITNDYERKQRLASFGKTIPLNNDFLLEEIEYVTGRFLPEYLNDYLTIRRDGRGISPRVDRHLRESIINDVITPYNKWKKKENCWDWNDLAIHLAKHKLSNLYDIIIADETQDFSANQIRAINNQLTNIFSLTFVLDTAQRIYPRGFTWHEAGISVRPEQSRRLERNYRNTIEIARFVTPLIEGLPVDEDATLPDFSKCEEHGPVPIVLKGLYQRQVEYVIRHIKANINLQEESVAILHTKGGGWFKHIKSAFSRARFRHVELTRQSEWPQGEENIAFSTIHSSKGLEFDHVIILGLNKEVTKHGEEEGDDQLITLRRLLAVGIGRARKSVILGYKPEDVSRLIDYLDPETFVEKAL